MPLIYRGMQRDGEQPVLGHETSDTLGVREVTLQPNGREGGDVKPINGVVQPGTGGMSVSPSKDSIPDFLVPIAYRNQGYPGARRRPKLPVTFPWRMGDGPFADGTLYDGLQLRIDLTRDNHGFVEPAQATTLDEFQAAIEATQEAWLREEW